MIVSPHLPDCSEFLSSEVKTAKPARRPRWLPDWLLLAGFTALGFVVMGYHPGLEDDGVYLAAVKARLDPGLFPFGSEFFRLQMQATIFDNWMAGFVRLTGIPVAWAELAWQLAAVYFTLWGCLRIARRLFREAHAQWAAVAMVSAMLTLPVAGTALFVMDQHLHPRNLATALLTHAVADLLADRRWRPAVLLGLASLFHPLMAAFGVSLCVFLALALREPRGSEASGWPGPAAALPLSWALDPPNPAWRRALDTKSYLFLYRWHWYEWLGALAPLALFWLLSRVARSRGETVLARFAAGVALYGALQQVLAMVLQVPPEWVRLAPFQPMRYLQPVYLLMALVGGGLLGRYVLKRKVWRWAVLLLAANGGMLACQTAEFRGSRHLELPGVPPRNPWLEAFAWIKDHTPRDAYFALDPYYLEAPGEDYHGFRALAERSQLADAVKDAAMVTQVPRLGPEWEREVDAERDWEHFRAADFERLKRQFGVDWVIVPPRQGAGLDCRWHDRRLAVCAIP